MKYMIQIYLNDSMAKIAELPEDEQQAIGAVLLAEIDADRRWEELLAQPSEIIERMADQALENHRLGKTLPLDPDTL